MAMVGTSGTGGKVEEWKADMGGMEVIRAVPG